jgi:large subunit ribosomal protein L32
MPAVPKKKTSHSKQGLRRSQIVLKPPKLTPCPQCHQPRLAHHACPTCGTYHGREILDVGAKDRKRQERARREQQGR